MPTPQDAKELLASLALQCDLAMALVDVLLEEQMCLVQLQADHLTDLALQKEAMMLELEKRHIAHRSILASIGFEPNWNGVAQQVDSLCQFEPKLSVTFATLRETLQHAKRLNTINGELVTEQLLGLKDRIAILTAAAIQEGSNPDMQTYSAQGALASHTQSSNNKTRFIIR